jgi:hypothetical protein
VTEPSMECPHCGKVNDAVTCVTEPGATPDEGDISLCATCAESGVFTGNGYEVRLPTAEETAKISVDGRVITAQATLRARL